MTDALEKMIEEMATTIGDTKADRPSSSSPRPAAETAKPRAPAPAAPITENATTIGPTKTAHRTSSQPPARVAPKPVAHAPAAPSPKRARRIVGKTRSRPARGGDELGRLPAEIRVLSAELVASIVPLWRMRQRWHRAEKSLTLQGKAICRSWTDGDKAAAGALFDAAAKAEPVDVAVSQSLAPFLAAIDQFRSLRKPLERQLESTAKRLPVYSWTEAVPGFGALGLAALVGEAADPIGDYRSPACLWKRFGCAVIGAERQRKKTDADAALAHGYSPRRRSVLWNVGSGIIGGMGHGPPRPPVDAEVDQSLPPYRRLFLERLRYEAERDPTHAKPPVADKKNGEVRESFSAHAAARAKRYVEKRLLRDLWVAWRSAIGGTKPDCRMPIAEIASTPPALIGSKPTEGSPARRAKRPARRCSKPNESPPAAPFKPSAEA